MSTFFESFIIVIIFVNSHLFRLRDAKKIEAKHLLIIVNKIFFLLRQINWSEITSWTISFHLYLFTKYNILTMLRFEGKLKKKKFKQ